MPPRRIERVRKVKGTKKLITPKEFLEGKRGRIIKAEIINLNPSGCKLDTLKP